MYLGVKGCYIRCPGLLSVHADFGVAQALFTFMSMGKKT